MDLATASRDALLALIAQQQGKQRLPALCVPVADDPVAVHAKRARRMQRHLREVFGFVTHPEVAADNNLAERSLRPPVTARKMSSGTRSDAGTTTTMTTATLVGTWLTQGRDPLPACRHLLLSGQV